MGGEVVLRSGVGAAAWLTAAAILVASQARADNVDDDDLIKPRRITVSQADELLGQLGPDGKTLYFVSNRATTSQIFAQDLSSGHMRQLFEDDADVTWPRVSPGGSSLLYVSFRENAAGQLCVRRLPMADEPRCLRGSLAALQAEWVDEGRLVVVGRPSVDADLRVEEVTVGSSLSARPLLDRNLTSPAISPDGQWLVYVPITRTVRTLGPALAARASQALEVVPFASASTATPSKIALALPGQTGQPVFARDGKSLYVVQFFSDTNRDGSIDAGDHGVLFRVPISFAGGTPVAGPPEQLTETSWNCEYPAPYADRLIATCTQDRNLDLYVLPLDGEVPASWTTPQLANALDDADTLVVQQLLASRRLSRETTPAGRRNAMLALALVHFEREEFPAAKYYAEQVSTVQDTATRGSSSPLRVLVEEREVERRREQGQLSGGFSVDANKRLDQLRTDKPESPLADDLTHLARSEIFDALGDKGKARSELEAVAIGPSTPAPLVDTYYRRADTLYRELDDREALVTTCRKLAGTAPVGPDEQLRYARAAVRAMIRGLPYDEADARLARERAASTDREPEMRFAIDLGRDVLAIRDAHAPRAVGDALLTLYAGQTRPGRRRALVVDATERADAVDADDVLDALVQRDIRDVKPGTHERGETEDIYERFILARAYERAATKHYELARQDFESVAQQTGSLEAVVGAIDMELRQGHPPAAIESGYEGRGLPLPLTHFAKAYLLARRLPKLEGETHAKAAAAAIALLDSSWPDLEQERIGQALMGALMHEEYLQTEDLATAERADRHYLVALDLVADNLRLRALILSELGLLQTDVGNYRIALGYLLDRDRLPYTDDSEGLDVLLSKAQALLHVEREADAAAAGEAALAMIARNPRLEPYRLLALDWAALDNLAAGRFSRALTLYDEEIPLLDGSRDGAAERNRLVARVARAAAAVGAKEPARALADLDEIERRVHDSMTVVKLVWPHSTADDVERSYRLITTGLRASASHELGRLGDEAQALGVRRALIDARLQATKRVEIEQEDMLAEAQLAWNAGERHDTAAAGVWLARAMSHADDIRTRDGGLLAREQLDVLWLAARLTVSMKATMVPDLGVRLDAALADLAARREPALQFYARWFEVYRPLVP